MKPLSPKNRISLTIFLFLVFLIGAPALVLYSTGYRLGDALSLVKTGGVFIHSNISDTSVFVNDDFVENNGVILRNTLVQNLIPNRNYSIRVEKDGYNTWEKELFVRPNLVTEAAILMLPTEIEKEEIPEFLESDSQTTVKPLKNPEYEEIEKLFDNELEQFEILLSTSTTKANQIINPIDIDGRLISATTSPKTGTTTIFYASTTLPDFIEELEIEDIYKKKHLKEKGKTVAWLEGGNVHVVWSGTEEAKPYYFCIIVCQDKIEVSLDSDIQSFDFLPGRDDILIIHTLSNIFAIEIDNRSTPNLQPIYAGRDIDFRVKDNNEIFVKEGSKFFQINI